MDKKIIPEKKKSLRSWIWRPILASLVSGFLILSLNTAIGFNDRGTYIMSFLTSVILIFPSFFLIRFLGSKHKGWKILVIFLLFFVGFPLAGYFSDTVKLFRPNPLEGAVIYNGPMPEAQLIPLPSGEIISWFVGQANIFVEPKTEIQEVEALVSSINGKILTRIPEFGYYFIEVNENIEEAIKTVESKPYVLAAEPNLILAPATNDPIDLSDASNDSTALTATLLKSPDPSAGVISVQIDVFKGSHAGVVNGVREATGAKGPVLQIDVSSVKCGDLYCSSVDRVYAALASVLAGAQMNRQKVVVNIGLAVMPFTNQSDIFNKENTTGSNSWATSQWESFAKGILQIIESSEWAKKDNVIVSQAAGNGACLLDKNNAPLDCAGVDLSELMLLNHLAEKGINIYGVEQNGQPAHYSNHGQGVIMKEIPAGSSGTSMAAAQGWGETEKVWQANQFKKAKDINGLLTTAICPGGLQVCGKSCIPNNAECCNPNVYCLKPNGSCLERKPGTCYICPVGQKFCGMFCVDVAKKCQQEMVEQELATTEAKPEQNQEPIQKEQPIQNQKKTVSPNTTQNNQVKTIECHGKQWTSCKSGEQFYCPADGDPYCSTPGLKLCNGTYWQNCGAGYNFVCTESGAICEEEQKEETIPETIPSSNPSEESSGGYYDYNACTRKYNACDAACRSESDACTSLCPTTWGSDSCFGACQTKLGSCLDGCSLDILCPDMPK